MPELPLTVAWISYFPIEWLPDLPEPLRNLPRQHPATWQRVLLNELKGSRGLKLHVIVLRKQFRQDYSFERDGVMFHCLKTPGGWRRPSLFWVDTVLIRRCLRAVKPDLLHAWGTEDGATLVALRLRYPFLVTVQGIMSYYIREVKTDLVVKLAALLERIALSKCRTATAESTFSTSFLRQSYPRLDVRHVDTVPDMIFHHVQRRAETQPARFVFLGTLGFAKGCDILLQALDKLQADFHLVVIGKKEDKLMQEIGTRISEHLWSRIEFKQQLPPEAVAEELARATLMICPTRADTGPMVVKEAAVAGVPVVGSAVGGIPDYIIPGKNGLLFPSGDVEACTKAIQDAAAHPLFGKGQVDTATLTELRTRLSPPRMAQQFFEIYQQVGAKRR